MKGQIFFNPINWSHVLKSILTDKRNPILFNDFCQIFLQDYNNLLVCSVGRLIYELIRILTNSRIIFFFNYFFINFFYEH